MRDNDSRLANRLFEEIANQIGKCLGRVVDGRADRETKTEQIKRIDSELLSKRINILAPLIRRRAGAETVNKQERFCVTSSFHLIKYVSILPWIATLFAFQYCIRFANLVFNKFVVKSQRSNCSSNHQCGGK